MVKKTSLSAKLSAKLEERKAFLMQDTVINFPELWMEVYIAGDKTEERAFAQWLVRSYCSKASEPDEADLVIFTGGPDVNPALYGEKPHKETRWSDQRDKEDIHLWNHCVANGIPMLGVCRGAQFGAVMKGSKLYQHVDNHYGDHHLWDIKKGFALPKISSVHHQMVMEHPDMEIIADCYQSDVRWLNDKEKDETKTFKDIEAFFFPDVCFLGVQGHPEYKGFTRYSSWVLEQIDSYIISNPNVALTNNVRRIKPDCRVTGEVADKLKELV